MGQSLNKKANEILNKYGISVYNGEKELIEYLQNLSEENIDEMTNKTLVNIDNYLKYKEKMMFKEEDYEYIKELAKELNEQSIRKTDEIVNSPIFKITNINGEERYFLTRASAKEYMELHKNMYNDDQILVEDNKNTNLLKIAEIIKKYIN